MLDKFLQILEDGRLTDGQGITTYFSECVLIFTSTFDEGQVTLDDDEMTLLGRDPGLSRHARLFKAYRNVSRRHATIGVDTDGHAWIRDEESVNGTFVNDEEIEPHLPRRIASGDRIRLGASARAEIRTYLPA